MQTFKYEARNPLTGEKVKAEVQAETEQAAVKLIRANNLAPLSITNIDTQLSGGNLLKKLKKPKAKDKILFSRQLATLINAGLPLLQALRSVATQMSSKPLKAIINEVISDIEAGKSFSAALQKHPKTFNQIYLSLISAGEVSGTLDMALERIATQQEKDAEINSKVRSALIYPLIVLLVMAGVIGFMIVKVLPQVKSIYDGIPGASLPFLTTALLALSDFIITKWYFVVIIVVVLSIGIFQGSKTKPGRAIIDRLKMKAWPLSTLFMELYMARFTRTGTTLIASGVPLLQMMDIVANSINNVHLEESIRKASEKVRGGKSLAAGIEGDENFLPLVPSMLKIGEQSGSMEQMMDKCAEYYEKELDTQVKAISTIIEPVLMVILGIVAFIIVAAVLLPIYGLSNQNLGT